MGIVRPVKRKGDPDISEAIMVIPKPVMSYIKEFSPKDLGEIESCLYRLYLLKDIAICGPFFGAPHAAVGLEKLICLGAKKIWVLSWCGSISQDARIGDIILPTGAFSDEGTSAHYPISCSPSPDSFMLSALREKLKKMNLKFKEGILWTTDAPYRETEEKIRYYQKKGAIGVDMEICALMTVAIFRSASLASAFVVSDEIFDMRWKRGFSDRKLKDSSKKLLNILVELAKGV